MRLWPPRGLQRKRSAIPYLLRLIEYGRTVRGNSSQFGECYYRLRRVCVFTHACVCVHACTRASHNLLCLCITLLLLHLAPCCTGSARPTRHVVADVLPYLLPHSKACAGRNHGWRLAVIELLQQLAGVYASTGQISAALQTYQECVDMQVCSRRFPPVLQIVHCDPVANARGNGSPMFNPDVNIERGNRCNPSKF